MIAAWSEILKWLEHSLLGHAIRDAGVWIYAIINLTHILGIATLLGAVIVLDVKLLGWPREGDVNSIVAVTVPLSIIGFVIAITSGVCMLATNGSDYAHNPFLPIKFSAIFLALVNAAIATRTAAWQQRAQGGRSRRARIHLRVTAAVSLVCWLSAASAGRMIGYW